MPGSSMKDVIKGLHQALAHIAPTDLHGLAKAHARFSEVAHWARLTGQEELERHGLRCVEMLEALVLGEAPATGAQLGALSDLIGQMVGMLGGEAAPASLLEGDRGASLSAPRAPRASAAPTPAVVDAFATTARETLKSANVHLLALESDPTNGFALGKVRSAVRELGRDARQLGFEGIHGFALSVSKYLDRLADDELDIGEDALGVAFESLATLGEGIESAWAAARSGSAPSGPDLLSAAQKIEAFRPSVASQINEAPSPKRLGDMLIDAGAATREAIDAALQQQGDEEWHRRVGEVLVSDGRVSREQLDEAVRLQREDSTLGRVGDILVEMGAIGREELDAALAEQSAGGQPKLGEVLVRRDAATAKAVGEAIRKQSLFRRLCQWGGDTLARALESGEGDGGSSAGDPAVLREFAERTRARLAASEIHLVDAAADSAPGAALDSIIRDLHAIRQVAAFLCLDDISEYSRGLERLFKRIRSKALDAEGGAMVAGNEGVQVLKRLIENVAQAARSGGTPERDRMLPADLDKLDAALRGGSVAGERKFLHPGDAMNKKLGELLIAAGVTDATEIENALTAQASTPVQRRLGEILVGSGIIGETQLEAAIARQQTEGGAARLGDVLLAMGAVDPHALDAALDKQRHGASPRLGEVLVRNGAVSSRDVAAVLRAQRFAKDLVSFGMDAGGEPARAASPGLLHDVDKALVADFFDRARKHLANADLNLLRLEEEPGSSQAIANLQRSFRGIKRIAGYIGLDATHRFAFAFEKVLDSAAQGGIALENHVLDFAFDAVEVLNRHVGGLQQAVRLRRPAAADAAMAAYTSRLDALANGDLSILRREPIAPSAFTPKRLGELLVETGGISATQLSDALNAQSAESAERKLGEILLDEVFVSPVQLEAALAEQRRNPARKLGDILVEMGVIDPEGLRDALSIQRQGRKARLGEILVRRGYVSAKTVARALRDQKLINNLARAGAAAVVVGVAMASPIAAAADASSVTGGSVVINVSGGDGVDTDADGLADHVEKALGTDLNSFDTDKDGMQDAWEVIHGLDPLFVGDANADYDEDGLTNAEEHSLGSSPFDLDTDADGFYDAIEADRGTDAASPESFPVKTMAEDVNVDGKVDAGDIQIVINAALGTAVPVPANVDNVGGVNALDLQLVISRALNG